MKPFTRMDGKEKTRDATIYKGGQESRRDRCSILPGWVGKRKRKMEHFMRVGGKAENKYVKDFRSAWESGKSNMALYAGSRDREGKTHCLAVVALKRAQLS